MRKDEEVREIFYMTLEDLTKKYRQPHKVTINAPWITIQFGIFGTVKGRGYVNALRNLFAILPLEGSGY